jgi:hypothetical protein
VSIRLPPAAYAHGLAVALPDKVAMARPTGVRRARTHAGLKLIPFEGAEEWLRDHAGEGHVERSQFDRFLATRLAQPDTLSSDQRERLFQQFLQWSKPNERR